MPWYMAILVRGSHVGGVLDEARWADMLYRLIHARDAEGAYEKAMEMGEESEETVAPADAEEAAVTLRFLGLADLAEIPDAEIGDGTEVYCQAVSGKPRAILQSKEQLTVFEAEEDEVSEEISEDPLHPR